METQHLHLGRGSVKRLQTAADDLRQQQRSSVCLEFALWQGQITGCRRQPSQTHRCRCQTCTAYTTRLSQVQDAVKRHCIPFTSLRCSPAWRRSGKYMGQQPEVLQMISTPGCGPVLSTPPQVWLQCIHGMTCRSLGDKRRHHCKPQPSQCGRAEAGNGNQLTSILVAKWRCHLSCHC